MRIDKFIWCIRLAKTRTLAGEIISKGKIKLNSLEIKPSREVTVGDAISFLKHNALFEYKVLEIPKSRLSAKLVIDYLLDLTSEEELEKFRLYQLQQSNYRKDGTGKPSTKARRDIKRFLDN